MLTSLKYTAGDLKEEAAEQVSPEQPAYPWGLQIRLEDEELTKLGLTGKDLPQVGGELHLNVVCSVQSVNSSQMADGEQETCVCLQITMAEVQMVESADDEAGEVETPAAEAQETRSLLARR